MRSLFFFQQVILIVVVVDSFSFTLTPTRLRIVLDISDEEDIDDAVSATGIGGGDTIFVEDLASNLRLAGIDAFITRKNQQHPSLYQQRDKSTSTSSNDSCMLLRLGDINNSNQFVNDATMKEKETNVCAVILPIAQRQQRDYDSMTKIWEFDSSFKNQYVVPIEESNKDEAFLIKGDDYFVQQSINQYLPQSCSCIWKPTIIGQETLSPIQVWRLRSNPGIMGLVLSWNYIVTQFFCPNNNDWELGKLSAYLRKVRQPCSAMDYPPTIFMVGEDEIS